VIDRWGEAIRPSLPSGPLDVVDAGAGTGIFAAAWPRWAPASVVAVEPAAAMVRVADRVDPAVRFVRGVAEALPLRERRSDVVWVSTALHHFADVDQAVGEFARVLRHGGRVLVRTYVPGRTEVTYVEEFPGRSKWTRRFHDEEELLNLFGAHGLELITIREVLEGTETYAASAEWVSRMRNADSVLTALSDEEITEGLAILRANPGRIGRLELTLLAFERP
jgi:SAM-dependent methyltransferase